MKALLSKLDPHTVTAIIGAVVGLAVANGLVTNDDGKIVTGFATAAVALGVLIYGAIKHKSKPASASFPAAWSSGTTGAVTVTQSPPPPPAA